MTMYFAYGSNLDWRNWSRFCARHNADPHCMKAIGPAFLPDVELVFNYRSVLREGGALNIRLRKGQAVHGVLYEVNARGWEVLDLKESVAIGCYARTKSVAITPGGHTTPVVTYVVTPARTEGFIAPSDEYTEIVLRGLSAHGLASNQYEKCALGVRPDPEVEGVFVYGTLMRDESRFASIHKHGPVQTLHGRTRGRLHETAADYPMLDLEVVRRGYAVNDEETVLGEFIRFSDLTSVLETLDEVEQFFGYASRRNEYVRTLVEVDTDGVLRRRAWTYAAANRAAIGPRIDSGCWRTFRKARAPQPQH